MNQILKRQQGKRKDSLKALHSDKADRMKIKIKVFKLTKINNKIKLQCQSTSNKEN